MADKKTTDYTEKLNIVNDDLLEIIDSEEIVISEKNKKIKFSNLIKGQLELKTWFVNPSASGGNGRPQNPFTVNEAMSAASSGDVIIFQPGTYTSDISVSKNLHFVGYSRVACIINVTNFVFDTADSIVVLSLNNFTFDAVNSITQEANNAFLSFRNVFGACGNDLIIKRVIFAESEFSAVNITTSSFTTINNSRVNCTTFTIDGTSTFDKATINADIAAAGRTLIFYNSFVDGDVNCANLTYKNTVITGTRIGTTSTTVNNQENFGPGTSINNAAVLVLNGTPQAIKAAEGADVILIPQQILIRHNFVSAAFATNTTLQIGVGSVYVDLTTSVLTAGSTQIDIEDISGLFANISANQAINIKVKTGNPSAGGGSLDVWVIYKRIDVS